MKLIFTDFEAQAALHRDPGRRGDEPGFAQLHQGLRKRPRRCPA